MVCQLNGAHPPCTHSRARRLMIMHYFGLASFRRYYRPCEVPETVYQLLVQDRNTEQGAKHDSPFFSTFWHSLTKQFLSIWRLCVFMCVCARETGNRISFLHDPVIKGRELFISDATDTYPVSLLRYVSRRAILLAVCLLSIVMGNSINTSGSKRRAAASTQVKRERERETSQDELSTPRGPLAIGRQHPTHTTRQCNRV